ncbi:methyltransferase domain-containing protein [Actinoplanes sp. CA-030573]|uniref:methyltransferase domain-containing protein n=1 Tax=Actinoplanes sp. CA-030573 TaxID=3239898 RepID=UPI003D92B29B
MTAPDQISYMDAAASTAAGADYKQRSVALLDLRPGLTVADIGCGPGTDLGRLADETGETGLVLGIDRDPAMLAEARRRFADDPRVSVREGDIHDLPLESGSVDRARADRMLQHVESPAAAIAEVRRVLRPGGLFGMAEPDWDTLAVGDEDLAYSRGFAGFSAGGVRNPTIGRELPRLCAAAGFAVRHVIPVPVMFQEFETADRMLGLRRNSQRAIEAGVLDEGDARAWLARLERGPLVAGFTFYLVVAEA